MSDKDLIFEVLKNVAWSIDQIIKRFQSISSSADLVLDDKGMEKLDSICMQLINVGEGLKYLDKLTDAKLLAKYPGIDWKKAKGLRDIITHHYFDIDAETIHAVCTEHIPKMKKAIEKIIDDVQDKGL